MDEMLWSEYHRAKYHIGDLVCLCLLARETPSVTTEQRRDLRRQLRSAIAYARSISDQRNADLRDFPPAPDDPDWGAD